MIYDAETMYKTKADGFRDLLVLLSEQILQTDEPIPHGDYYVLWGGGKKAYLTKYVVRVCPDSRSFVVREKHTDDVY